MENLGKQIWVTKHKVEGLWLQVVNFIKTALKNWSPHQTKRNCSCIRNFWRQSGTLLVFLDSEKFVPDGVPRTYFNTTTADLTQAEQQEMQLNAWTFPLPPHPPYSQDMAPSDFNLFAKLKEHLKGQHFSSDEEVKCAVGKWCQKQNTNFFKDGFQHPVQRWRKCVVCVVVILWWNNYVTWKIIYVKYINTVWAERTVVEC